MSPKSPKVTPISVEPAESGVDGFDPTDTHTVGFQGSKNRVIVVRRRKDIPCNPT